MAASIDIKADARSASASLPGACRARRSDTVIATAVLALLLAGWAMNFVEPRRFLLGIGSMLTHGIVRQV